MGLGEAHAPGPFVYKGKSNSVLAILSYFGVFKGAHKGGIFNPTSGAKGKKLSTVQPRSSSSPLLGCVPKFALINGLYVVNMVCGCGKCDMVSQTRHFHQPLTMAHLNFVKEWNALVPVGRIPILEFRSFMKKIVLDKLCDIFLAGLGSVVLNMFNKTSYHKVSINE